MKIKRFKTFRLNEMSSEGNILDNTFILTLLENSDLNYMITEDPDGITFDIMDAITVFRHDYNEDHPFIHYLNELAIRFHYSPAMGLSHDSLEENAIMIYDELAENEELYKSQFSEGVYESKINEGISSEGLNPEQLAALEELKTSDVTLFDENDFQSYADKIGVSIEQVMELVADGGTSSDNDVDDTTSDRDSDLEFYKERVQKDIIDNESVGSFNIDEKLADLADEILENTFDHSAPTYDELLSDLKMIYNELRGGNNPNQMSMKFESIKRFKDFINESTDWTEEEQIVLNKKHKIAKEKFLKMLKK